MPTILLVDDDQDLIESLDFFLSRNNYHTIRAKDGVEAVNLAYRFHPDLILLDIKMPNIDGLTACQEIRNIQEIKDIPVIMLTAKGEIEDVKAAFKAGANDYVPKPFEMDQVKSKIEELLGTKVGQERKSNL